MKTPPLDHDAEQQAALRRFNILDTAPEAVIEDFLQLASHICRTPISFIGLVDNTDRQAPKPGPAGPEIPRDVSFCATSSDPPSVFVVTGAPLDERYTTHRFVSSEPNIRFYTGVAWTTPKGEAIGTLCVAEHIRGGLNLEQREALHALGRLIVSQVSGTTVEMKTGGGEPSVVATVPQIVWTALPDGTLDYYNHYWYNHPALTREYSQGKHWQTVLHPDDLQDCLRHWAQAVQSGQAYGAEYRFKRPSDGAYHWHVVRATPFRDQDGSIIKWLGSATDIEDEKRAEERQRAIGEELERLVRERTMELLSSNDKLSELAHVAAHDLQEPLRMVESYIQLLARRYQGRFDPAADEFIQFVMDGTLRMQRMIDGLLAYSQVGSAPASLEQVDCNKVFNEVVSNLQVAIQESNATVTGKSLPTLYANHTQLVQLLQNLIGNAIKCRAEKPPKIQVRAEHREGCWQFSVRDNGIGIDPQFTGQIFMLFQRLPGQVKYTGTGIGLAICKKIVESLGGRIWVESEPGAGSTFYFTLPDK
ncbi:MAG: ATP-binding protein [Gammaproteobacteria bacterium]|nr:ATP-binding protein [Gammaproteobacteria bacterium]